MPGLGSRRQCRPAAVTFAFPHGAARPQTGRFSFSTNPVARDRPNCGQNIFPLETIWTLRRHDRASIWTLHSVTDPNPVSSGGALRDHWANLLVGEAMP